MNLNEAIIGGLIGGLIAGTFSLFTTYMVMTNSLSLQSRAITYEVLKGHKKNYLNLIVCKENIRINALKFSEAMFKRSKSNETYIVYRDYKKYAQSCVAEIVAYNMQLEAVNVKSNLSNCILPPLTRLSNNISQIYSSDQTITEQLNKLDKEFIYELPTQWDMCLDKLNTALLEKSKQID